jgi:hypothetical protein
MRAQTVWAPTTEISGHRSSNPVDRYKFFFSQNGVWGFSLISRFYTGKWPMTTNLAIVVPNIICVWIFFISPRLFLLNLVPLIRKLYNLKKYWLVYMETICCGLMRRFPRAHTSYLQVHVVLKVALFADKNKMRKCSIVCRFYGVGKCDR